MYKYYYITFLLRNHLWSPALPSFHGRCGTPYCRHHKKKCIVHHIAMVIFPSIHRQRFDFQAMTCLQRHHSHTSTAVIILVRSSSLQSIFVLLALLVMCLRVLHPQRQYCTLFLVCSLVPEFPCELERKFPRAWHIRFHRIGWIKKFPIPSSSIPENVHAMYTVNMKLVNSKSSCTLYSIYCKVAEKFVIL